MNRRKIQFVPVDASSTARHLLWIAGVLAVTHAILVVLCFIDGLPVDRWLNVAVFDLDEKESIGTWFSTLLLFGAGLLTILTGRLAVADGSRWAHSWSLLGSGFMILPMDEVAGFHETINTLVSRCAGPRSARWRSSSPPSSSSRSSAPSPRERAGCSCPQARWTSAAPSGSRPRPSISIRTTS
ncbi:MAG: hypothetical protein ACPGPE_14430 [Planctomycetota bacterium]